VSAPSIGGLWTYPSRQFPAIDDFMHIDEERHRIVAFVAITDDPLRHVPMRAWCRWESAMSLSTCLDQTGPRWKEPSAGRRGEWHRHDLMFEDERLVWPVNGEAQPWRRVAREEYPGWLDACLATANERMDLVEKNSQSV